MTKSIPLFRILLGVLLAWPAWCAAGPAPETKPKTEAQLWEEIGREQTGNSGPNGQARSYLAKYAGDEERMTLLAGSVSPKLGEAVSGAGGGALDAAQLKAFFKDPSNNGAAGLLVYAALNEGARQGMVKKYSELQEEKSFADFNAFLTFLAKDKEGPEVIHRILTEMSEPPKAPRAEGDQDQGDGAVGGHRQGRTGRATPEEIERLNRTYWNSDEMYGAAGKDPNVLSLGGRVIAFNVVTIKAADGTLSYKLTVYDRTDPADVHGRSFLLDDAKLVEGLKFKMDDRPTSTHADEYTLKLVPDAAGKDQKIVFEGTAGAAPADFPSVNSLFLLRAQKVLDYGYVVKVGAKEFYLGGEGHSGTGQNTFWDPAKLREMLEKAKKGEIDPRTLAPDMATVSVTLNAETKKFEPVARNSIGQVDGKWYDIVWNKDKGLLEVAEGQAPAPGGTGGGTPPGDWPALQHPQLGIELSVANGDVADINAQLEAANFNVRIYSCKPRQRLLDQYFLAAKSGSEVPNIRVPYVGGGNASFIGFDLLDGSVLAVRDAAGTRYFDMMTVPASFQDIWFSMEQNKSFKVGGNVVALKDALTKAGAGANAAGVIANLSQASSKPAAVIYCSSGAVKVYAEFDDGKIFQIWPTLEQDSTGAKPEDLDRPGTGHALDQLGGGSQTAELPGDTTDINGKASTVVKKGDGAAVFKVTEGEKSSYFAYMTIKTPEGTYRYGPKLVFQDPPDVRDKFPGADRLNVQGVVFSGKKPEDGELKFGTGRDGRASFAEKGIWAVWHGEKTCLGVVAYWGMTAQEADALCPRK